MAFVVRITTAGQPTRTQRLERGRNKLTATRGTQYELVDEATGLAPTDAQLVRDGDTLRIDAPGSGINVEIQGFFAGDASSTLSLPGAAVPMVTGETALAAAEAGGSGALLGILGGLAAVGGGVALAAGGGGSTSIPAPAPRDTTPPVAPTGLALEAADDSGSSNSDRITRTGTGLTITGTAEAGSTVELLNGTIRVGTGTASAAGTFSIDIALPEGAATITARATDAAGNASPASVALAITVDTAAPAAPVVVALAAADDSGTSSSDRITSQASGLTIAGTAQAGARVELFNGTTALGSTTADASGNWTVDVTLPVGAAAITARAIDVAGNVSATSAPLAITVDTAAPAAPVVVALAAADDSGTSSSDRITSQASGLTITGTAEAGARVELFNGATALGSATADAVGNWSADIALSAGAAAVTARAADAAGNLSASSAALAITVDTAAPAALSLPSISGGFLNTAEAAAPTNAMLSGLEAGAIASLTLSGNAAADPVSPFSVAVPVATDGSFALSPATLQGFADGTLTLSARQTDLAGNAGPAASSAFVVDRAAPTLVITSSANTVLFGQTATIRFTFSEDPQGFAADDIVATGGTISALAVDPGNPRVFSATLTPTAVTSGPITIAVAGAGFADAAGNAASANAELTIAYDAGSSGAAIDGYIANALVFRDIDNDGTWDREAFTDANDDGIWTPGEAFVDANGDNQFTAEAFTRTDSAGNFANLTGSGRIVLAPLFDRVGNVLTRDISTGGEFTKSLSAPAGSTVVTPLTTLVAAVAGDNATAAEVALAETRVKAALGIDSSVDLGSFDPISVASGDGDAATLEQAVAVQRAAVQVANVLAVVATASTSAGGFATDAQASQAAAEALAEQFSGGSVDLTNSATVSAVISGVAASGNSEAAAAINAQGQTMATALASLNEAVASAGDGADAGAALAQIVAVQIVAQVTLSGQVEVALGGGAAIDATDFSGAGLAENVDAAAANVQVVVPVAPRAGLGAPDRPVVDDGTRVSAAELADGINVAVGLGSANGAAVGDTLRLALDGVVIASRLLNAADIAAGNVTFPITASALGADGSRLLVAEFVAADDTTGAASLPLLLSIDTGAAAPVLPAIASFNAAGASTGRRLVIGGIEIGASLALTLSGKDALEPTQDIVVDVPRIDNIPTLSPQLLARFADGTLTLSATQTDALGNISSTATASVLVDRIAPAAPLVGDVSGGTINVAEAAAGVNFTLSGIVANTTASATITGANGAAVALTANLDGSYTLSPALLASLGQGVATVAATQTDAVGNSSAANTSTVLIATVAPAAPAGLDLAAADDDGVSNSDNITRQTQGLTISGNAPALASVELRADAVLLATTIADAEGRFSADITLPTGAAAITARATDAAGNISAVSAPLDVRVLLPLPPAATLVSAELADGILDVSEVAARLAVTGTDPALPVTATVTGTRNGAPVTLALGSDMLDPDFGTGDRILVEGTSSFTRAATPLADGRVIVAVSGGADSSMQLVMLRADGSLDTSFGGDGRVAIDVFADGGFEDVRNVVAVDGGYAVLGSTSGGFTVVRLDAAGDLVSGFGTAGVVRLTGSFGVNAIDAANGKLIVTGGGGGASTYRLNADGSLDTSFGTDGRIRLSGFSRTVGAAFTPDGKLVTITGGGATTVVSRYSADGVLDTSFGTNGRLDLRGASLVSPMVEDSQGRLVIAGFRSDDNAPYATVDSFIARFNPDGTLDTSFGDAGFASIPAPVAGWDRPTMNAISVAPDGRITAAGSVVSDPQNPVYRTIAVRLNADGSLDTSFDGNGIYLNEEGGNNVSAVAARPDGSIVTITASPDGLLATRLDPARQGGFRLTLDDHLQQLDPGAITLAVSQSNADGTQVSTLAGVWSPTTGSANRDTITGTAGADIIDGKAGSDTIRASSGTDSIDGGADNDLVIFGLPAGVIGSWTTSAGFGADAGVGLVQLVNGTSVIPYYRFQLQPNGSIRVEAVGPNPVTGATTLRNVETIEFRVPGAETAVSTVKFTFDQQPAQFFVADNTFVQGSIYDDTIDVPTLYPLLNPGANFTVGASAGNDSVIGSTGGDFIEGGDGNDSIDGGAGIDTASFLLQPGMIGTLRAVNGTGDDAGSVIIRRMVDGVLGESVYKVTQTGPGAGTVQGLGSMAQMGTDTLVNLETLSFVDALRVPLLSLNLATTDNAVGGGLPNTVTGSIGNDTINVPLLYPTAGAGNPITVNGGPGNDALIGHAGTNNFTGGLGDDFLDGGAGANVAIFNIFGGTGYLRAVAGTDAEAGQTFVERFGSDGTERLFSISTTPGTGASIAPLNSAAALGQGTDIVTNVETLFFSLPATSSATLGGSVALSLNQATGALLVTSTGVSGTANAETIDATLLNLPATSFVTLTGAAGNDTLIGHAGNGTIEGGAGDDSIDGGAGTDTARYILAAPITGSVVFVMGTGADAGSAFFQRVSGAERENLLRITPSEDGSITVTGLGAAANLGTDRLVGIENVQLLSSTFAQLLFQNVAPTSSSTFVAGSPFADTIDLNTVPGAASNIGANGGLGDDIITGSPGNNNIEGGGGNDSISGGAGNDLAIFNLANTLVGSYRSVAGPAPNIVLIERVLGVVVETVARVTVTASGAATVEGLGEGAIWGIDTVSGVETLQFRTTTFDGTKFIEVLTGVRANPVFDGSAFAQGSIIGDTIDFNALYPTLLPTQRISAQGGGGNDNIIGRDASTVDFADFGLPTGTPGTYRWRIGSGDDAGNVIVERVDGANVETVFRVSQAVAGGPFTVQSLGLAEALGTDTLAANIDNVNFFTNGTSTGGTGFNLAVSTANVVDGVGAVDGSPFADRIDLNTLFPTLPNADIGIRDGGGNDIIIGNAGRNFIDVKEGNDSVDGGAGSDVANFFIDNLPGTLRQVAGPAGTILIERVDGGTIETIYRVTPGAIPGSATIEALGSAASLGTDTVTNIEQLNFNIRFNGTGQGTVINLAPYAGAPSGGNAFVDGSEAGETIDVAALYPGDNVTMVQVSGRGGNDIVIGNSAANRLFGDAGDDIITGGGGNDEIHGGEGTDVARFSGNRADYSITRNPANNEITVTDLRANPTDGIDTLIQNIETLRFADDDVAATAIGAVITGTAFNDQLNGTPGADTLDGLGGDDGLSGQGGDDRLIGGPGNDYISGGGGDDVAVFSGNSADYDVFFNAGGAVSVFDRRPGAPDGGDYVTSTTDRLLFLGDNVTLVLPGTPGQQIDVPFDGPFTAIGSSADDQLNGNFANDTIEGRDGDDSVFAGDGDDIVRGEAGDDEVNGWNGNDTLTGGAGRDVLRGDEGDDILIGGFDTGIGAQPGDLGDELFGGAGNDVLFGGDGDDRLFGDAGNDDIRPDAGNDVVYGGDGIDLVSYRFNDFTEGRTLDFTNFAATTSFTWDDGRGGTDQIFDVESLFLAGTSGNDTILGSLFTTPFGTSRDTTLTGFANILAGQGGDDAITGGNQRDRILGGSGNDSIFGLGGDDDLTGGTGNDSLDGGADTDTAIMPGTVQNYSIVRLAGGNVQITDLRDGSPEGTDTLTNVERLSFTTGGVVTATYVITNTIGDDSNQGLFGNTGNDLIVGNGGDDYMNGFGGTDLILGGSGRDTAAFNLPVGTPGSLRTVDGANPLQILVQHIVGEAVETIAQVDFAADGAMATIIGLGSQAARFGTTTVQSVEQLDFFIQQPGDGPPLQGQFTAVVFAPFVPALSGNFAFVSGGEISETIDVAALYPLATAADTIDGAGNRGDDVISGHDGINRFQGNAGNDTLRGLGGNDSLQGDAGNDVIEGGSGDDYIQGNEGDDSINGGSDNDNLQGHAGNDVIEGGSGDDYIQGNEGDDSITGGSGNDISQYVLPSNLVGSLRSVADPVNAGQFLVQRVHGEEVEDMFRIALPGAGLATVTGLGTFASFGTDTIAQVEALHFTVEPFNQALFLSFLLAPSVQAPANGNAGFIDGTVGADAIDVAALLPAATGLEAVNANGRSGDDVMSGHAGNNNLNGGAGNDSLDGRSGNDRLQGDEGNDRIEGGPGTDFVIFELPASVTGPYRIIDGTGPGLFIVERSTSGNFATTEIIFDITVVGSTLADATVTVTGVGPAALLGTDTLTGVERLEFFPAGGGAFTALNLAPTGFVASGGNPAFVSGGIFADSFDLQPLIPGATATTAINSNADRGDDIVTGNNGVNSINGSAGNDTLRGLGGNDTLIGGAGADTLEGGDGDDALIGGFSSSNAAQPGDGADVLRGGAGNDIIRGGDGDDQLFGDDGDDNLRADLGNDLLDGGPGVDFASYFTPATNPAVTIDFTDFVPGQDFTFTDHGGGTDTLRNIEILGINGTNFDDVLRGSLAAVHFGNGFANQMSGGGGNDMLVGGNGKDRLDGGPGSDTLDGGGGSNDVVAYDFASASAAVNFDIRTLDPTLSQQFADPLGGTDTLINLERVFVAGSGFDDTIRGATGAVAGPGDGEFTNDLSGGAGNDALFGGNGNDVLTGGAGRDTLTGGGGDDVFVLDTGAGGTLALADVITDFSIGADMLLLPSGTGFANLTISQGTGADSGNTIVSISSGTILAMLLNVDAAQVTAASFQ